jgi:anti-sigma-K factor RskA
MSDKRDQWADTFSTEPGAGWLSGFLADEDALDRRTLWRLGSWGVGAVAAVIVAILAGQSSVQLRREQDASADMLTRQSQQIQSVAKETQTEAKRLSQAIDTLNSDRDRLYARVTSVEQGLDSVT